MLLLIGNKKILCSLFCFFLLHLFLLVFHLSVSFVNLFPTPWLPNLFIKGRHDIKNKITELQQQIWLSCVELGKSCKLLSFYCLQLIPGNTEIVVRMQGFDIDFEPKYGVPPGYGHIYPLRCAPRLLKTKYKRLANSAIKSYNEDHQTVIASFLVLMLNLFYFTSSSP